MQADAAGRHFAARLLVALAAAIVPLLAGGCSVASYYSAREQPAPAPARSAPAPIVPSVAPPARELLSPEAPDIDAAVALASNLRYVEAEARFRQMGVWYAAAGQSDRAAECVFWTGFCLEKQGRIPEARTQYDKAMQKYPNTIASRMSAERLRRLSAQPAAPAGPAIPAAPLPPAAPQPATPLVPPATAPAPADGSGR